MKKNIIDVISLEMMTENMQFDNDLNINDDDIIDKIRCVDDIDLQGNVDGRTLLIHASFYNRIHLIKYLLNLGANICLKDNMGLTALHAAVISSNKDIVQLLLLNGSPVNAKDNFGNIPLFHSSPEDIEIIKLLLSFGADCMIENNYGVCSYQKFTAYPDVISLMRQSEEGL